MIDRVLERVGKKKIVAIVRGIYSQACVDFAEALYKGGIDILEVTFDQKYPESWQMTGDTIALLNEKLGDKMVFGAGTVTTVAALDIAAKSGAAFIVSPGTDPEIIKKTVAAGLVSMPGAMTPTEVIQAYSYGAHIVKVFPASVLGTSYFKALRAPISHIPLMATGGVSEKNAREFLEAGADALGVGGNLANRKWIEAGEFEKITEVAEAFVTAIR